MCIEGVGVLPILDLQRNEFDYKANKTSRIEPTILRTREHLQTSGRDWTVHRKRFGEVAAEMVTSNVALWDHRVNVEGVVQFFTVFVCTKFSQVPPASVNIETLVQVTR